MFINSGHWGSSFHNREDMTMGYHTIHGQEKLQRMAQRLGQQDARQGRVYRHSADPGSWLRNWLDDYEKGWNKGRAIRLDEQR